VRVVLDHCVDRRLADSIKGHEVATAAQRSLDRLENGELLAAAAALGFEVLITTDRNLRYQQNLERLPVTVVELAATDTRLDSLLQLVPFLEAAFALVALWRFISVHSDGEMETLSKRGA